MADRVEYDRFRTGRMNYPYRSESLYGPDLFAMNRVRPGGAVQVIREHGDEQWTDATFIRTERVDPEMPMRRFVVAIDGAEHKVSEDRIRPAQ